MPKSTVWYVADFETTTYQYYLENGYTRVWLYAICDSDANIYSYGDSIERFISDIRKLYGKTIYFHNLKFDGAFILDYLLNNDYQYYENLKDKERGFTTLIGDMGQFYSIEINFSKGKRVHIHDSLKLLPFKVEKIAKDFNLPILKKTIDYNDYTINDKTLEYVFNDVKIVAMALKAIKKEGMIKMTTASCAYNQYTGLKSDAFLVNAFPELDDQFLNDWRKAYRGGRCQVNPLYQGKVLTKGVKRYDINSMYPYIMHDMELPYGNPIKINEPNKFDFELYHIKVQFSLRENHLPSLLRKGSVFGGVDTYYIESDGIEEIYISSIDMELLERNYNIEFLEYIDIYGFRTTKLLFFDYVDMWYKRKQVDKGAKRLVDKLMLNSLYGKFGSDNKGKHKIPRLEDNIVEFDNSEECDMKKYYLPVAIAITSYAHLLLDNAINKTGILNFVYCDTDSIHTLGSLPNEWVDNSKLGKFKLEGIENCSKYVRQKCYIYKENNEINVTCAGLNEEMKDVIINRYGDELFKYFQTGFTVMGKLLPKRVPGGVILYETTFEIK